MRTLIALTLILLLSTTAAASWSGSQLVTLQWEEDGFVTIYTTTIDYALRADRFATAVIDHHSVKGTVADVFFTQYVGTFHASAGMRKGVWRSTTPWQPYISFGYRF